MPPETFTEWSDMRRLFRRSLTAKIVMIGIVILLCQIPILLVFNLISQRQALAESVEREIATKWGYRQKISGPLLAIPLTRQVKNTVKNGNTVKEEYRTEHSTCFAVPQNLKISGTLTPEIRYRGIYEIVLYRSRITLTGEIVFPETVDNWQARPEKSRLIIGISDLKGLSGISGAFNGTAIPAIPGISSHAPFPGGFSLPLNRQANGTFTVTFDLNGCRELLFSMTGRQTDLDLRSDWNAPSFCGAFLPTQRTINDQGFSAQWSVSEFNRDLPATWIGAQETFKQPTDGIAFGTEHHERSAGVALIKVADSYQQVDRAVEYAILIFVIMLMAMLIAEKITRIWVHPLQYFIEALALVLFYALTLAISEHTSFGTAYLIAAAALCLLSAFYSALIYRKLMAALSMGLLMGIAYAAIFVILQLEDFALLAGSIILFVLLTVLMIFTGKINRMDPEDDPADLPPPTA